MVKAVEAKDVRSDITYKLADGPKVPHMGQKTFTAYTHGGHLREMVASVSVVEDAALTVSKLVKAGTRIVFDDSGSYIEHKLTGEVTPLAEQRGLYKLNMWVPKDQSRPF